jgi:hypothetical protein
MERQIEFWGLGALLVVCLAGCGSDDGGVTLAGATGVITHRGSPVPRASVVAFPDKGPLAMGNSDDQGKFTLWTGERKGVAVGRVRLAVKVSNKDGDSEGTPTESAPVSSNDPSTSTQSAMQSMMKFNDAQKKKGKNKDATKSPFAKYADETTSGLFYEIRTGTNELSVDLK